MPINPKNKKENARSILLRHLGLPKGTSFIVLSYIKNPQILAFFRSACDAIGAVLITEVDDMIISGSDIWITDILDASIPVHELALARVVPVVPSLHPYGQLFSEFDPMKFEGNAFIFANTNQFQMFVSLMRAIENMRYSGDKRTLLQNVESMTKRN